MIDREHLANIKGVAVVIYNEKTGEIVMGNRTDGQGYSLPGGKIEEGESFEGAAIREVREETGLIIDRYDLLLNYVGVVPIDEREGHEKGCAVIYNIPIEYCKGNMLGTEELKQVGMYGLELIDILEEKDIIYPPTQSAKDCGYLKIKSKKEI